MMRKERTKERKKGRKKKVNTLGCDRKVSSTRLSVVE